MVKQATEVCNKGHSSKQFLQDVFPYGRVLHAVMLTFGLVLHAVMLTFEPVLRCVIHRTSMSERAYLALLRLAPAG